MTKLLDRAIDTVRALPPEAQEEIAGLLLQLAGEEQPMLVLSEAEAVSLEESLAQADRGEFADDNEVRAVWSKHGL